tara:strand:+ start:896 stop:1840 length:945 start_codon:yes stop_codon:yes gene_type:complete
MKFINSILKAEKTTKILVSAIVIILSSIIAIIFLLSKNSEIKKEAEKSKLISKQKLNVLEQKEILNRQFYDLIDEHNALLQEYEGLNNEMESKDSIIQNQINEIKELLQNQKFLNKDLKNAKNKIAELQKIAKRYQVRIVELTDSLSSLTIINDSVIKVNKTINWKNYTLNKENQKLSEKISKGSALELTNVSVTAYRTRRSGEKKTERAKKVQFIETCFEVTANKISDAGIKTIYMQIISPSGEIFGEGRDAVIELNDQSLFYPTISSSINYLNEQLAGCIRWQRINQLEKGLYEIKLVLDGNVVSQSTIKLK